MTSRIDAAHADRLERTPDQVVRVDRDRFPRPVRLLVGGVALVGSATLAALAGLASLAAGAVGDGQPWVGSAGDVEGVEKIDSDKLCGEQVIAVRTHSGDFEGQRELRGCPDLDRCRLH